MRFYQARLTPSGQLVRSISTDHYRSFPCLDFSPHSCWAPPPLLLVRGADTPIQLPIQLQQASVAVDIGGGMAATTIVEKAKGRQVFEAIVRRGVDPALLETNRDRGLAPIHLGAPTHHDGAATDITHEKRATRPAC